MNTQAQGLLSQIRETFVNRHLAASFSSIVDLFLKADGQAMPERSETKSASALSRFLNQYSWSLRPILRSMRQTALAQVWEHYPKQRGRRPTLQVIVDLTSIEKSGLFKHLPISELDGVRGVHLVVVFLFIGELRIPWGLCIWQGKGTASQCDLALKLLKRLPNSLVERFRIRVLADAGFSSCAFLGELKALGFEAVVGMRRDRSLDDKRKLCDAKQGEEVMLTGLGFPVWVAWFDIKRKKGTKRYFVISLSKARRRTIKRWGSFRWRIEAFFKTMKQRFSLGRFGQSTRLGVYRFLALSMFAYLLTHLHALAHLSSGWPDWRALAHELRLILVPELVLQSLLRHLEELKPHLPGKLRFSYRG